MSIRYIAGRITESIDPLAVPDAATSVTATATAATTATVAFTAPANPGVSAVTGYSVVQTTGGTVFTSASSPISITGLSGSTSYTFQVWPANAAGVGPVALSNTITTPSAGPTVIGQSFQGGYYAGQISTAGNGVADFYLIVAPKATGETNNIAFATGSFSDPTSVINGPANSTTMNNANHPAAQYCKGLTIGGYTDWYLPAKNELELLYYYFKPFGTENITGVGANSNAVPPRGNYTTTVPPVTPLTAWQSGGSESFSSQRYWSSTQHDINSGLFQEFFTGNQNFITKTTTGSSWVRAVRRVAV